MLDRAELEKIAGDLAQGEIEWLDDAALKRVVTIGQYLTDRCAAELHQRGLLVDELGCLMMPYESDHMVPSPLVDILEEDDEHGEGAGAEA